ncbi:hypothetical protein F4781DRAFT_434828 [Annulohypoxylon bovei var. microspora]|nr:hypothetical protein F4781DRAFT_434828 [Annulohypoxylon bovei var. microspora]
MEHIFHLTAHAELGLRDIHLACLRGDLEAVVRLASQPGIIDVPTEPQTGVEGGLRETPIKLAALMGYVDIVWFLFEQGAALAHDRVLASTYTGDEGLAARRRDFFLNTVGIGREHPDASNTRKIIHDILSSPGRRSVVRAMRGPRSDLGFPDYKLAKQGRDIVVFAPVLRIRSDIPLNRSKTIGIITSKDSACDILMSAHSGFRAGGDRHEKCLDTNHWNYIALHHIAELIKFHFPGNLHDNGAQPAEYIHRGRAHAGHVEVLLAAWYAVELTKKHVAAKNGEEKDLEWCLKSLPTLKVATLGHARSAVIMIDSQPCATCLKFINFLFQYTGLHFSVKGAVGVGPTLATKDERTGIRLDTFGDVFLEPDIDGAEEYEESSDVDDEGDAVLESPLPIGQGVSDGIRDTIEGNGEGEEEDDVSVHAQAQAASEAFAGIFNISPEPDMDTDDVLISTPVAEPAPEPVTPQRVTPFTPIRPRMRWGVPDPGSRPRRGDPFSNIPSRRPANPDELLAEYKKKTPVWTWPGYDSTEPSPDRFCRPRLLRPPFGPLAPLAVNSGTFVTTNQVGGMYEDENLTSASGEGVKKGRGAEQRQGEGKGQGVGEEVGGDTIIVDMTNDSEVSYSSPDSSSAIRESIAAFNARINNHFENTPSPLGRERTGFSYSSFQPIANPDREKPNNLANSNNMAGEEHLLPPQSHPQSQSQSQTPSQFQFQANFAHPNTLTQPNLPEDEEGYIYVPQLPLPPSQQSHPLSQQSQLSQQFQPFSQPTSLSQTGTRYYNAALLMDAQSRDPTPRPAPARSRAPVPSPSLTPAATPVSIPTPKAALRGLNFQQWRFEPQPYAQGEVSRHFEAGPKLLWQQAGPVSFPAGMECRPERRGVLGRRG